MKVDLPHLPKTKRNDIQTFTGMGIGQYEIWSKPRGVTMAMIICQGPGGNGGNGAIGANSAAAGGGGGGSGARANLLIPVTFLPEIMYISAPVPGQDTFIAIGYPTTAANNLLLRCAAGGNGGNAAAATAGAAGAAGGLPAIGSNALAGLGTYTFLAGQAGIIGGVAVAGGNLTLPATGLPVTGGTGGGGLPAAAATGTNGGSFVVPAQPNLYPAQSGGVGSATATSPAANGSHGFNTFNGLAFAYGGTGGASTHGTATGAGLRQSIGGDGGWGCGGGGSGGALTASVAGLGGRGGNGFVTIICW
jgi:hypothetical protein